MSGRDDKSLDDALDNGEQNSLTMGTGNQSSNLTATFITQSVDNFTVELWVKPTATHEIDTESPYGYAGISGQKYVIDPVHGGLGAPGDAGMGISVGTNGVSVYEHADGYMPPILVWSGTLTDWTHIAVVYENKQPRLYINGLLVRTGPYSQRTHIYPGNLVASGYYGTMQGQVDEVRVWSVIRTQAQIAASMNSTVSAPQAGLAAYWPLKESDGTTLVDISGNNYNVPLNTSYGTGNWSSSTAALESYRSGYRYGFNGKENDKDIGEAAQDYGMRIYDSRLARFLSVDPLTKKFPMLTPYQFASNTPLQAIDLDGLEAVNLNSPNVEETLNVKSMDQDGNIFRVYHNGNSTGIDIGGDGEKSIELKPWKYPTKARMLQSAINGKGGMYKDAAHQDNSVNGIFSYAIAEINKEENYQNVSLDGIGNTFRHLVVSSISSSAFGQQVSKNITDAHEVSEVERGRLDLDNQVDIMNNFYGRQYTKANKIDFRTVIASTENAANYLNKLAVYTLSSISEYKSDPAYSGIISGQVKLFSADSKGVKYFVDQLTEMVKPVPVTAPPVVL